MVTFTNPRGVTLSANATLNGFPIIPCASIVTPGRGDFAARKGGRIRRLERRAAIARKHSFLEG